MGACCGPRWRRRPTTTDSAPTRGPPAIISIFLGDQLMDVFDQIDGAVRPIRKSAGVIELGVDTLPPLKADPGDRNRTSPFAFTGNRLSTAPPAPTSRSPDPMVAISTILADSLDFISPWSWRGSSPRAPPLPRRCRRCRGIVDARRVIFNGDGCTPTPGRRPASRGLKNLRTTVDAVVGTSPRSSGLRRYGVLSARELKAREDVIFEYYALTLLVGRRRPSRSPRRCCCRPRSRFRGELAATAASLKAAGVTPRPRC